MDAESLAEDATELAPLSNHVHVQAVPARGAERRCRLGDAYFDVRRVLRSFVDRGFDGFANVEFVDPTLKYVAAIEAELDYLRSLF